MKSHYTFYKVAISLCILSLFSPLFPQTYNLSGRVYSGDTGNEPPNATALSGITVSLYGGNSSGQLTSEITSTTTDGRGWYQLTVNTSVDAWDFYIIKEFDDSDYYSVGATSAGGTVLNNNQIQYEYIELSGTKTGNKFWDKPKRDLEVYGNDRLIKDGSTSPSKSNDTDFGSIPENTTLSKTYTIENTGNQTLTITGVDITGPDDEDFTVTSLPSSSVSSGSETSFTIQFHPTNVESYIATVNINNNSALKSNYDFAIKGQGVAASVPEIEIQGESNVEITDGDTSPSIEDDTDFGSTAVSGGTITKTFFIYNTGTATLNVNDVSLSGTNQSDFSVSSNPSSTVAAGNSTSFQITFDPSAVGVRQATVSIANNDSNENPYDFAIQGTGTEAGAPEIDVKGNGISIVDGDNTPSTTDDTDFGSTTVSTGSITKTYTIVNTGTTSLVVDGVVLQGPDESHYSISSMPASSIAADDSAQFQITFNPTAVGVQQARVSISNSDADEDPFDFAIQGTGTEAEAPEIDVRGNGISIADGDDTPSEEDGTDYGIVETGSKEQTFVIHNLGVAVLTISEVVLSTDAPFELILDWPEFPASIPPGESLSFIVEFFPPDAETYETTLEIHNNDQDRNPYDFALKGAGKPPILLDYGDAPDPTYPTLKKSNGASHGYDPDIFLGTKWDDEKNGQPDANARGDDNDADGDDEDGVWHINTLEYRQNNTIRVYASIDGLLNAWLDYNSDGDWADNGEHIFKDKAISGGPNDLTISVPKTAKGGDTFARFRFDLTGGLSYTGDADYGEVEDYKVTIRPDTDFGDAPLPYPSASHKIDSSGYVGPWFSPKPGDMGGYPDDEKIMQRTTLADGDDNNGYDDEGGAYHLLLADEGKKDYLRHTVYSTVGFTSAAWIDYNGDGDWDDAGEKLVKTSSTAGANNTWSEEWAVTVPSTAKFGNVSCMRLRVVDGANANLSPGGDDWFGEVEDYPILIPGVDFCDAPASYGVAYHGPDTTLSLGKLRDREQRPLHSPDAMGDDKNQTADDDGVTFKTALNPGQNATIGVTWRGNIPTNKVFVACWIDYNADGVFQHPTELVSNASVVPYSGNSLDINFKVPANAKQGITFARVRLYRYEHADAAGFGPDGFGGDGEVEDYQVTIGPGGPTGDITIIKAINPPDPTVSANFTGDLGNFSLTTSSNKKTWNNISAGTYTIKETLPQGYFLGNYQISGDLDGGTTHDSLKATFWIDLDAGENISIVIYNYKPEDGKASVGDRVWNDLNVNGLQDPGEPGLGNVPVSLFDNNGNLLASTSTLATGFYSFSNLTPGNYFIRFSLLAGYSFSPPDQGTDDTIDSDAQPGTGDTPIFTLAAGSNKMHMDAGMYEDIGPQDYDYGDAPDPSYPTLRASNGARHIIDQSVYMGSSIDGEQNGQQDANALGDDGDGNDDEDGIVFLNDLIPGSWTSFVANVSVKGNLGVWVDFNGNGSWADKGESTFDHDTTVFAGANTWGFYVPSNAKRGKTFVRFRYSIKHGLTYDGEWPDGEVEDYQVEIKDQTDLGTITIRKQAQPADNTPFNFTSDFGPFNLKYPSDSTITFAGVKPGTYNFKEIAQSGWPTIAIHASDPNGGTTVDATNRSSKVVINSNEHVIVTFINYKGDQDNMDYGDAPDPNYPTLLASNGARHKIVQGYTLGSAIDGEPNGFQSANADGDNTNGTNDEDGVKMSPLMAPGQTVPITIDASTAGAVNAWIDYNGNGSWGDAGEHIIAARPVTAGANSFTFTVPATAKKGQTYARFRFSSVRNLGFTGEAPDGEVEDYTIAITGRDNGTITVIKDATPKDNTSFMVCAQLSIGFFNIHCDFLQDPKSNKIVMLNPSLVTDISEASLPGWTLKDITITGDTDNGSIVDLNTRTVTPDFDQGENIVITFKNEKTDGDSLDFGDAPLNFPSASHEIGDVYFGDPATGDGAPDAEKTMQRTLDAMGDDNDGYDDEEHNTFKFSVKGKAWWEWRAVVATPKTSTSGWISYGVFIDWNQDGDWNDASEQHHGGYGIWGKKMTIGFGTNMPSIAKSGKTIARVRIVDGYNSSVPPDGALGVGEVCDFEVDVTTGGDPLTDKGTIWGAKWHDVNGNGVWDATENGLAGWDIWLDANQNGIEDAGDLYDKTDSNGYFSFIGLKDGTYIVGEDLQPGWVQTYPGTITAPATHSVKVDASVPSPPPILFGNMEEPGERDFGDAPSPYPSAGHELGGPFLGSSLSDAPDADPGMQRTSDALGDDNDGNDDEGSIYVATTKHVPGGQLLFDVNFCKQNANWLQINTWIDWNQDGDWNDAGELDWAFSQPVGGWAPTGQLVSLGNTIPKTAKPGYMFIRIRIVDDQNVTLTPGGDFGPGEVEDHAILIEEGDIPDPIGGRIGGAKWNDLNKDGLWGAGEPALPGWTIYLDLNKNGTRDSAEPTVVTDSKGRFMFSKLKAGTYIVAEEQKTGWIQTAPPGGTHSVKVDPTQPGLSIAFGNYNEEGGGMGVIKWSQPPLLHEHVDMDTSCFLGWHEQSTMYMPITADDWFCYDPRPVTAIRWWGGYAEWDSTKAPETAPDWFRIGVWTDVPRHVNREFSHPGEKVHQWGAEREFLDEHPVGCMLLPEIQDPHITTFEYMFQIPEDEWFFQEGDSTVYWLSITAMYEGEPPPHLWGWLTREHYFHDDAVRMVFDEPNQKNFMDGEPIGHRWDLAFQLGTDEYIRDFDFGDAPDIGYATLEEHNGAHHRFIPGIHIGDRIETEFNGQPHERALGDDLNDLDDEDGVHFGDPVVIGQVNEFDIQLSTHGYLSAWLDMSHDGNWYEEEDNIIPNFEVPPGDHRLAFTVPDHAKEGETFVRVRFSREADLWFNGFAMDGEVEDYVVNLKRESVVETEDAAVPREFKLYANYPNPFNPATTIAFDLPRSSSVTIDIYNVKGEKVCTLLEGIMEAGAHEIVWDGRDRYGNETSSGLYFCTMKTEGYQHTVSMLYLK